jgi:hypothetical protein
VTVGDATGPGEPEWELAPVPVLRRWEHSGAVWRVLAEDQSGLTIALLTCDAGEEVARFRCHRGDVVPFLGARRSSEDLGSSPPA